MIDTTKLRELAQKATPGPWHYFQHPKYKEHHVSLPIAGSGMIRDNITKLIADLAALDDKMKARES